MSSLCFEWVSPASWPHAVSNINETYTTADRAKVTCESCLWALGTQTPDPPHEPAPDDPWCCDECRQLSHAMWCDCGGG